LQNLHCAIIYFHCRDAGWLCCCNRKHYARIFLIPVAAMLVMWYKLDEGALLLILVLLMALFPDVLNTIFSAIL